MMRLRYGRLFAGCLSAFLLVACGVEQAEPEGDDAVTYDPAAVSEDVVLAFSRLRQQPGDAEAQIASARRKVEDLYLLAEEARRSGLLDRRTVAAELELQTVNWIATRQLSEMARVDPISDEDVRAEYDAGIAATGNQEYRVRHILVGSVERAQELIGALQAGEAFVALEQALVGELGASNAGALGWVNAGQVPPEFVAAVSELEPGRYTDQPVRTEYGFHVILLEEARALEAPPYEEVQASIRSTLARRQVEEYLARLRAAAASQGGP